MGLMDNFKKAFVVSDSDEKIVEETAEGYGLIQDVTASELRRIDDGGQDIARTIRPSKVIFHEDYFKLNETYCRVIYLEEWPVEVWPNWLRDLYQYNRALDISLFYEPLAHKALLNKLKQKSAREAAELEHDEAMGNSVDFARRQRLEDALQLQNMLQRGETRPFAVGLLIQVKADNLRELNELTVDIETKLDAFGARTRRADLRQKDGFLSMLPTGRNFIRDSGSMRNMHTAGAQYTFPLANADLTHPDGIWYGINQSTNSNVILDRFQLKSPHAVVFGSSGSGKSYGAKLEMLRALMLGMRVTVIDPDAECRRLCEAVGGQFITIGPTSPDRINVLDFSAIADGQEDHLTPKIWSVAKLIGSMMNTGSGFGMSAQQFEILERLMRQMYQDFGYTQDPRTQVPLEMGGIAQPDRMPVLSDLRTLLEEFIRDHEAYPHLQAMVQEVVSAMGPYCGKGALAGLFDQKTTVNLREQFVVFNINPLTQGANTERLMALGMHTVLEFIWNTTMNKTQAQSGIKGRRLLYIDEAHIMMRTPESADFLADLVKRARKFNVGVTLLTQDPKDFVRHDRPQGAAIIGNSAMRLLLNMNRDKLVLLAETMELDPTEIQLLSTQPKGVGMVFAENDRAWISMHTASPWEHRLITTNPDEVARIEAAKRKLLEQAEQPFDFGDEPLGLPAPAPAAEPSAPSRPLIGPAQPPVPNSMPQLPGSPPRPGASPTPQPIPPAGPPSPYPTQPSPYPVKPSPVTPHPGAANGAPPAQPRPAAPGPGPGPAPAPGPAPMPMPPSPAMPASPQVNTGSEPSFRQRNRPPSGS